MKDDKFLTLLQIIVDAGRNGIEHHTDFINEAFSEDDVLTLIEEFLELGFVKAIDVSSMSGTAYAEIKATKKGKDRLNPDGGETVLANTVIIKFHDTEILDLIKKHISAAPLPKDQKQRLLDQLRELPADSIKYVALKLMDMGLNSAPGALAWPRTLFPKDLIS